jgi:catechol 2,3-dioxygenase-like lactoylglutathione lyase family enzyme
MRIVRVDHTSFTVNDIEESNAFFAKLGFEPEKRYIAAGPDAEEGVGIPGADIDISWLKHPDGGPMIELLRYRNEEGGKSPLNSEVGAAHLALCVEDVQSEYERLSGDGVTFVSPPHADEFGVEWVYMRDPDGNVVELLSDPV